MSFLSKLHENCDCQRMNMRITERPGLRCVWDLSDFWNIHSRPLEPTCTQVPMSVHPVAPMGMLQIHLLPVGFCSEQLKNFQQTYRRQDERRLLFYISGPESPPLPFAPQALSPRDMCNFPFILTVWYIFSPKASGAWEPYTKWRSSDPAAEDFWGVPVPAPTEVWLLTIPEFPRHFRT